MKMAKGLTMQEVLIAVGVLVVLIIGGYFLVDYEKKKAQDAFRASAVNQLHDALEAYYKQRDVYPPSEKGSITLGNLDSICLGENGFSAYNVKNCQQKNYLLPIDQGLKVNNTDDFVYVPLNEDGQTVCNDSNGCPNYKINFYLETNKIARSGQRVMTPTGIK